MDRTDVAYVVNSTPKYFFMLPLHFTLLRRYAAGLKWPIYFATESKDPYFFRNFDKDFPEVNIIPLTQEQAGFFESRAEAVRALPPEIKYVFPMQEDFLLEERSDKEAIEEAMRILDFDSNIDSIRFMPCPGPKGKSYRDSNVWSVLRSGDDLFAQKEMVFTYQATIWRREAYQRFMDLLLLFVQTKYPAATDKQKVDIAIKMNLAEIEQGQEILIQSTGRHLAWKRQGQHPNAVYLSPWPYRPTAIVRGKVEPWALDLAVREGMPLLPSER